MTTREQTVSLLLRYEEDGAYLNLLLDSAKCHDKALLTVLLYGTVEHLLTLDYAIAVFTKKPVSKLSHRTRAILEVGFYQIYYLDHIPKYAVVNEMVSLASNPGERSLLNALLRKACQTPLPLPEKDKNFLRYLSIAYSVPLNLLHSLTTIYSSMELEQYLKTLSLPHTTSLHINTNKISVQDFKKLLLDAEISYEDLPYHMPGVSIEKSGAIQDLPGFAEGYFFVQDLSSMLCIGSISSYANGPILDLCAAPGGKSFAMAIATHNRIPLASFELHASKLSLITSGKERLGLSSISVQEGDATKYNPTLDSLFSVVLCDVPCSGLGVLQKKPDLRYASIERLQTLPELQAMILDNASHYVANNGLLIYSTCTLMKEENEEQISRFLEKHPDFIREDFSIDSLSSSHGMLTLHPHIHHTDGFFISHLRKRVSHD